MPWFCGASSPEDQFAREVTALVRGILGLKAKRVDDFASRIERPDGPPVTMSLRSVYAEAQEVDGDARGERLRLAVLAMVPQPHPASWREAAPLLIPAVRAASWANAIISPAGVVASAALPFGKPLVPFVKVLCAIDSEHAMSFATVTDLAAWGVTDDEALRGPAMDGHQAVRSVPVDERGLLDVQRERDGLVRRPGGPPLGGCCAARLPASPNGRSLAIGEPPDPTLTMTGGGPFQGGRWICIVMDERREVAG
jgi:hypothetical protein